MNGTRRSRSQWWARPWTCRCPGRSAWPSSFGGIRARRLGRASQRVGNFNVSHAQFVECILQEIFFGGGKITLRLLRMQSDGLYILARADHVNVRLAAF